MEVRSDGEDSTPKSLSIYSSFDPRREFRKHHNHSIAEQPHHFMPTHHIHHQHHVLRHAKSQAELHTSQCALLEWYNKQQKQQQQHDYRGKGSLHRKKSVHFDTSDAGLELCSYKKQGRHGRGHSLEDITKMDEMGRGYPKRQITLQQASS